MYLYLKHLMLLVAMLLSSITTVAYDFKVDDIYYNIVSIEDLTCEVTSGENAYTGEVVIPGTVTYKNRILSVVSIGKTAFKNCKGLISITIPNSITSIDDSALSMADLKNLIIEDGESTLRFGTDAMSYSIETLYIGRNYEWGGDITIAHS